MGYLLLEKNKWGWEGSDDDKFAIPCKKLKKKDVFQSAFKVPIV